MTVVRPLALFLASLLTLSGCSLLQPKPVPLYQLDAGEAVAPTQQNGVAVLVGPVSVADYLRNGKGATTVAAYSLRAREGLPVSVPIWREELPKIKSAISQCRLLATAV